MFSFFPALLLQNSTGLHKTLDMCNYDQHITGEDDESPRGDITLLGSHRQSEMELEFESRSKCPLLIIHQALKSPGLESACHPNMKTYIWNPRTHEIQGAG